jgi:hypothetical protein
MITNEQFDTLTPEQKRCAIAQDVIDRLDTNLMYGMQGKLVYVQTYFLGDLSLKDAINSPEKTCHACAKGAMILSWIGNFNKYTFDDLSGFDCNIGNESYPEELLELFGRTQLDLMEAWFEGNLYSWTCDEVWNLGEPNRQYEGNLRGIMENIIKNNGTFVPEY